MLFSFVPISLTSSVITYIDSFIFIISRLVSIYWWC